jgi:hypothetical protein
MNRIFIILLFLISALMADINSTSGQINFDTQMDNLAEMTLNETGLGIGTTPSSNLHVNGNTIISNKLYIGDSSGSANINIQGSIGFGIETISDNVTLFNSSITFCDTSSDNIELVLPDPATISSRIFIFKKTSRSNKLIISTNTYFDASYFDEITLEGSHLPSIKLMSVTSHYITLNSTMENPYTPWQPTNMGNLLAWYDASDQDSFILNSGNVGTWKDKSGNDYHMIQNTTTRQPVYSSQDNVTFIKSDQQFLSNTNLGGDFDHENVTILCLFYPTNISTAHVEIFGSVTIGGETGVNSRINYAQPYNIGTFSSDSFGRKPTLNTEELLMLHNGDVNGATARQIFSDTVDTEAKKSVGALSYNAFSIGASRSTSSRTFSGYIKEFMLITKDLTTSERELLEGYIAWKWNRENDLPSNHPFKSDGSRFGE